MRGFIYQTLSSVSQKFVAPIYRSVGKSLYLAGTKLEGENASEDRLVPSLRNLTHSGARPDLEGTDFVAPNATVLGNVTVGINSSIWYGATIIGTKNISIGDNCVIQDRCHLSREIKIGNNVFVGPNSIIQGSQLADNSFVSMGATVRHAKIEAGGLVAAGAVISDNVVVKQGEIWAGNPGKFLRNITPVEREVLRQHLQQMKDLAVVHSQQTQKNSREVISGKSQPFQSFVFEQYLENMFTERQVPNSLNYTDLDEQFIQRRTIMRQTLSAPHLGKDYEPFEYNISHLGEKFNLGVHNEQFARVATKVAKKERFEGDKNSWTQPF